MQYSQCFNTLSAALARTLSVLSVQRLEYSQCSVLAGVGLWAAPSVTVWALRALLTLSVQQVLSTGAPVCSVAHKTKITPHYPYPCSALSVPQFCIS